MKVFSQQMYVAFIRNRTQMFKASFRTQNDSAIAKA